MSAVNSLAPLLKLKAFAIGELNCHRMHVNTQDLLNLINKLLEEAKNG